MKRFSKVAACYCLSLISISDLLCPQPWWSALTGKDVAIASTASWDHLMVALDVHPDKVGYMIKVARF